MPRRTHAHNRKNATKDESINLKTTATDAETVKREVSALKAPTILETLLLSTSSKSEDFLSAGTDVSKLKAGEYISNIIDDDEVAVALTSVSSPSDEGWREREVFGASLSGASCPVKTRAVATGARNPLNVRRRGKSWRERELGLSDHEDDLLAVPLTPDAVPQTLGGVAQISRAATHVSHPSSLPAEVERSCHEDGWRWQEASGAFGCKTEGYGDTLEPRRSLRRLTKNEDWRELEVFGASASCVLERHEAKSEPCSLLADAGSDCKKDSSAVPELGDVVILGFGAPPEYRQRPAVVTRLAKSHCTVTVLDDSRSFGIGECWPCFGDIQADSCCLRLGTRVVIEGMRGAKTQRLNGCTGTIAAHPREGHPTFIRKPSAPDQPRLTACVHVDNPTVADEKVILLEARFLVAYDDVVLRATCDLENAWAKIVSSG
jgi:hypothetical protein